ncbi:hypothetical protein SNE40_013878 [Patella caerulea]|uniref:MAGE domain-containing protein n=1 Tax=Patella caerulea TaxID=87958 RepID=A0AAN8PGA1_PATCE
MKRTRQPSGKSNQDELPSGSQSQASQNPSQSQATSLTQAEKAAAKLDQKELELKVNDLVQYLLIMDQKKYPIKKVDINKVVLKDTSNKAFPLVMKRASEKLADIFGIDVIELQDKQKGSYILISKYEIDADKPNVVWPEEDNTRMGLLMIILSLVFMNNNIMQDSEMWHTLKKLGIDPEVPHETFGDVKKLITSEFVRQGYLEYIRQPQTDPSIYDFKWGQRAKAETSKRNILHFVSQMYDVSDPQQWTSQWQDKENEEEMEVSQANSN